MEKTCGIDIDQTAGSATVCLENERDYALIERCGRIRPPECAQPTPKRKRCGREIANALMTRVCMYSFWTYVPPCLALGLWPGAGLVRSIPVRQISSVGGAASVEPAGCGPGIPVSPNGRVCPWAPEPGAFRYDSGAWGLRAAVPGPPGLPLPMSVQKRPFRSCEALLLQDRGARPGAIALRHRFLAGSPPRLHHRTAG